MRKICIGLVMALGILLSGCYGDATPQEVNELEEAFLKMDDLESYRMDMEMGGVPVFGTMTLVYKFDGDLLYINFLSEEAYSKVVNGLIYEYVVEEDGTYTLSSTPIVENSEAELLEELDYSDFELVDEVWVSIEDIIYLDLAETEYLTNVQITLSDEGYVSGLSCKMYTDELNVDLNIEFSGFGNTTVVVPGVE